MALTYFSSSTVFTILISTAFSMFILIYCFYFFLANWAFNFSFSTAFKVLNCLFKMNISITIAALNNYGIQRFHKEWMRFSKRRIFAAVRACIWPLFLPILEAGATEALSTYATLIRISWKLQTNWTQHI